MQDSANTSDSAVPNSNNGSSKSGGSKALIALLAIAVAGLGIFAFSLYNEKKKQPKNLHSKKSKSLPS